MNAPLEQLQRKLDYRFQELTLLERALRHRSVSSQNNERLEYLGDSILNFIIAEILFHQFPLLAEGALSRMRATLVNRNTLATIARTLCLGDYLHMGSGENKSGGHSRPSILSDAMEAIIAAIYLDSDMDACRRIVHSLYAERLAALDTNNGVVAVDAKTRLQERLQKAGRNVPGYAVERTCGPSHRRWFEVSCYLSDSTDIFSGEGHSRQCAEQMAATKACAWLDARERDSVS